MKYNIKASFVVCINMYKHRQRELKFLHQKQIQIEQDLTEINTEELIKLLQNLDGYFFENNHIIYNRFLTDSEIKQRTEDLKNGIEYDIYRLKKWCEISEENKTQITGYLKRNNILIKEINNL